MAPPCSEEFGQKCPKSNPLFGSNFRNIFWVKLDNEIHEHVVGSFFFRMICWSQANSTYFAIYVPLNTSPQTCWAEGVRIEAFGLNLTDTIII